MNSFDKLISLAAPELPRQTNLVGPVMTKISQRKRRARLIRVSLFGCLGLGLVAILANLLQGNAAKVVSLGLRKYSSIPQHPGLYVRALIETLPWPAIAAVAGIALMMRIMQRNQLVFAKHVTAALAVSAGALLVTASASAATISDTASQPGPAQQQLERTVNGIGKQDVTIDGRTYEINPSSALTDRQIKAYAELQAILEVRKMLDLPVSSSDGGTLAYNARVASMSATELDLTEPDPTAEYKIVGVEWFAPAKLKLSPQTIFLLGGKKVGQLDLRPGDYLEVATAKDFVTAAYVAKLTYDPSDYAWAPGIYSAVSKHRNDGRCYNNLTDKCPNLPAVYDLIHQEESNVAMPSDGVIREVFGQLMSVDGYIARIKTSSGAIWSFNFGDYITSSNNYDASCPGCEYSGLQIKPGDYLRVEFWQHRADLNSREVFDQTFKGTKAEAQQLLAEGKLNLHPEIYVRMVQVPLNKTWYPGQQPDKYKP